MTARWFRTSQQPISHMTFYCTDAVVDGIYAGSDLALEAVSASDLGAAIIIGPGHAEASAISM